MNSFVPVITVGIIAGGFLLAASEKPASNLLIAIQPFEGIDVVYVQETQKALETNYHCKVRVLPVITLPGEAFTKVKTPRYRANMLLEFLNKKLPKDCDHVIGLTSSDISTTKYEDWSSCEVKKPEWKYSDWGIFGLGQMPGTACVVSTFRLKAGVDEAKFRERLRKITCHEIGHNLGLPHCEHNEKCFMRDAVESIATVDAEAERLCPRCADLVNVPIPQQETTTAEQAGAGQPATRSVDKPEGSDKPQPEAEGRCP